LLDVAIIQQNLVGVQNVNQQSTVWVAADAWSMRAGRKGSGFGCMHLSSLEPTGSVVTKLKKGKRKRGEKEEKKGKEKREGKREG
jgi:hypothetical protein